jgi:tetratricopeptide (TPR) repeat protein
MQRAEVLTTAGLLERALAAYRENLDWARRSHDQALLARSHYALARQWITMSRNDDAIEHLDLAEAIYAGLHDDAGLSRVLLSRANVHRSWGKFDEALELLGRQQALADEGLTFLGIALKGNIHFWRGEFEQARAAFTRHLEYSRRHGLKESEITSAINLGLVCREQQQMGPALERLTEALAMARALGISTYYAMALGSIGGLHTYQKEFPLAIKCFEEQLRLARRMGDTYSACCAIGDLGAVYIELGELDTAGKLIGQETDLCHAMKDELGITFARYKSGIIRTEQGELLPARDLLQTSIAEVRRLGSDRFLELYLCQLAEVEYLLGDPAAAGRANAEAAALQAEGSQTAVPNAIMRAKLAARDDPGKAKVLLLDLLRANAGERAAITKALYQATGKEGYRLEALGLFQARYRESPCPKLRKEIEGLNGTKESMVVPGPDQMGVKKSQSRTP